MSRLTVVVLLGVAVPAAADVAPEDAAKAKILFDQGRTLITDKKIDEACETFEASYKLDPSIGTKLNLADCRELQGQLVVAYTLFDEAADEAGKTGKTGRETFARQHRDALTGKLVRVTLHVATPLADLTVAVAHRTVARDAWSHVIMVAPGNLAIDASAPGRRPFHVEHDGVAGGELAVDIPELAADVPIAVTPETAPAHRNWTPVIVGGTGGALLATSLVVVLLAKSSYNSAIHEMAPDELDRVHHAQHEADVATGFAIAGTAALAVGAVLYLRGRGDVVVTPTASGVAVAGRF